MRMEPEFCEDNEFSKFPSLRFIAYGRVFLFVCGLFWAYCASHINLFYVHSSRDHAVGVQVFPLANQSVKLATLPTTRPAMYSNYQ
jgi:hypothetical protein